MKKYKIWSNDVWDDGDGFVVNDRSWVGNVEINPEWPDREILMAVAGHLGEPHLERAIAGWSIDPQGDETIITLLAPDGSPSYTLELDEGDE